MKRGVESIQPPLPIIELVDKQSGGSKILLTENLPTTGEDSPKPLTTCRGDSPKNRIMVSLQQTPRGLLNPSLDSLKSAYYATPLSRGYNSKSRIINNFQTSSRKIDSGVSGVFKGSFILHPSTVIFAQQESAIQTDQQKNRSMIKTKIQRVIKDKHESDIHLKSVRHLRDAWLKRIPRNSLDSQSTLYQKVLSRLYELRYQRAWIMSQHLASIMLLLNTFFEPQTMAQELSSDPTISGYLYYTELLIISFCIVDTFLELISAKWVNNHHSSVVRSWRYNILRTICRVFGQLCSIGIAGCFIVDFIQFWHWELLKIRMFTLLRPIWLIQFHPNIKSTLVSFFQSFSKVLDIFFFFIVLSVFWGYMGYNLFSEYTDQFSDDIYFVFKDIPQRFIEQIFQKLHKFTIHCSYFLILIAPLLLSILGMYTLISMDTYPSIMRNIVIDNKIYLLFFIPYVALNLFFLLYIPVAVIFESYKKQRSAIMQSEERLVRKSLTYCFFCLAYPNQGDYISKVQFTQLLNSFYAKRGLIRKIENLYDILNIDKQGQMSLEEFWDLCDVMKSGERLYSTSNKCWSYVRRICNQYLKFEEIGKSPRWNYFILAVVMINTMVIIVSTFILDSSGGTLDDFLTNLDLFFNGIYVFDVILKIIGLGMHTYFEDPWNNFDFVMVVISLITIFGLKYIYFLKKAKSTKLIKLTKLQKVLKVFRSLRSLKLFKILKFGADALHRVSKLIHIIALCVPSVSALLHTYFVFTFSYAIIGIYIFNTDYNTFKEGSPYNEDDYTNFNSVEGALLALLQVMTQSKWVDFVYGYGYKFSLGLSAAYFCCYHMFSVLFFMSLLQGMIWDVFTVVEEYFRQHELEEIQLHRTALDNYRQICAEEGKNIDNYLPSDMPDSYDDGLANQQYCQAHSNQAALQEEETKGGIQQPLFFADDFKRDRSSSQQQRLQPNIPFGNTLNLANRQQQPISKQLRQQNYSSIPIGQNTLNVLTTPRQRVTSYHPKNDEESIIHVIKEETDNLMMLFDSNLPGEEAKRTEKSSKEYIKQQVKQAKESNENTDKIKLKIIETQTTEKVHDENQKIDSSNNDSVFGDIPEEGSQIQHNFNRSFDRSKQVKHHLKEVQPFGFKPLEFCTGDVIIIPSEQSIEEDTYSQYQHKRPSSTINEQSQQQQQQQALDIPQIIQIQINQNMSLYQSELIPPDNICPKKHVKSMSSVGCLQDQGAVVRRNALILASKQPTQANSNNSNASANNYLSLPGSPGIVTNTVNQATAAPKRQLSNLKRAETADVGVGSHIGKATLQYQMDKYLQARVQVIKYQLDIAREILDLEEHLKLRDQEGLESVEQRRIRIAQKHNLMNTFSISKQYALERKTFFKGNTSNAKYANKQEYIEATEYNFNTHYNTSSNNNNNYLNSSNRIRNKSIMYNSNMQQKNSYKRSRTPNRSQDQQKFVTLSEFEEVSRYGFHHKQSRSQDRSSCARSSFLHQKQPSDQQQQQVNYNQHRLLAEPTLVKLNGIFSFLLQVISQSSFLDTQFVLQKLFIVEQSLNQVIFGNYNQYHTTNQFKLIFSVPTGNQKYLVMSLKGSPCNHKDSYENTSNPEQIDLRQLPDNQAAWNSSFLKQEKTLYFIPSLFEIIGGGGGHDNSADHHHHRNHNSNRSNNNNNTQQQFQFQSHDKDTKIQNQTKLSNIKSPSNSNCYPLSFEEEQQTEMTKLLSDQLQYLHGVEFCLEDLTCQTVEFFASFVSLANLNKTSLNYPISSTSAAVSSSSSKAASILLICTRQISQPLTHLTQQKRKTNQTEVNFPVQQRSQSSSNQQNYLRRTKNPEFFPVNRQSNNLSKGNASELREKNHKRQISAQPSDQHEQQQKHLESSKPIESHHQNSSSKRGQETTIKLRQQQYKSNLPKLSIDIGTSQLQPPVLLSPKKGNSNTKIATSKRSKITQLSNEQENIVKIVNQTSHFLSVHSGILHSLVARISAQPSSPIPCYSL